MSFLPQTLPCFKCHSDQKKASTSEKDERLTRCLGCSFAERFYKEGIVTDELGGCRLAHFVENAQERRRASGCNADPAGRYFHQSCLGRSEPTGLSYSVQFHSIKKSADGGTYPELRSIAHMLCDDCLTEARMKMPDELRLKYLRYEHVTGYLQHGIQTQQCPIWLRACPCLLLVNGAALTILRVHGTLIDADVEQMALERTRADKRGSKGRKDMSRKAAKLEADGTSTVIVHTTRPFNQKTTFSQRCSQLGSSYHSTIRSAVRRQSEGLKVLSAAGGRAEQTATEPTVGEQPVTAAAPVIAQQMHNIRAPSAQSADQEIIRNWLSYRLVETARVKQLVEFLQRRGVRPPVRTKTVLLQRVAALLVVDHPEGDVLFSPGDKVKRQLCVASSLRDSAGLGIAVLISMIAHGAGGLEAPGDEDAHTTLDEAAPPPRRRQRRERVGLY